MSCTCFGPRISPNSNYLCRTSDIAAVGNIFNIFSYDVLSDQEVNQSPPRQQADLLLSRVMRTVKTTQQFSPDSKWCSFATNKNVRAPYTSK